MSYSQASEKIKRYMDPKNPPMFTFKLFKNAQEQIDKAKKDKGAWMTLRDASGQESIDPIPATERTKVLLHSLHDIAFGESIKPGWPTLQGALIDYDLDLGDPDEKCCDNVIGNIVHCMNDIDEWEESNFMKSLKEHLGKHAKNMERIDTIVGFGLGRIKYRELTGDYTDTDEHPGICWLQHAVCNAIKRVLQKEQGNTIEDYTQDPTYCRQCITTLGGQDAIRATRNALRFITSAKDLNEHTFVVSIAPTAPSRQIIFDLTADVGGPAGILCDTFHDETRRSIEAPWPFCDPPSARAIEYANLEGNRDMILELEDSTPLNGQWRGKQWTWNVFGNSSVYLKKKTSTDT